MRRHRVVPALAALALAAPSLAAAAPGVPSWTRIGGPTGSSLASPALSFTPDGVHAAWTATAPTSAAVMVVPLSFRKGGGVAAPPEAPVMAAHGWTRLAQTPVLLPKAGGGLQLLLAGARPHGAGEAAGAALAPRNDDGGFQQPGAAALSGPSGGTIDAIALPDGTPVWATDEGGTITVLRGMGKDQQRWELQSPAVGGCCGYDPALAMDGTGAVWLAWYSNAAGARGIHLQQIDPANGAPTGPRRIAPGSEASINNLVSHRLALACKPVGGGCRIVYALQRIAGAPITLVSWHPRDRAPVTIARPTGVDTIALSASYTGDGRHLWVAWREGAAASTYHAVYGDATGAGGTPIPLGAPADAVRGGYGLSTVAVGHDLVLATLAGSPDADIWANRIGPPNPNATPNTKRIPNARAIVNGPAMAVAPRRYSLQSMRRMKCVPVRLQATRPARVTVTITGGRDGDVTGRAAASFPRAGGGNRLVCVRLSVRPAQLTAGVPFRVGVSYQLGTRRTARSSPGVFEPFSFVR